MIIQLRTCDNDPTDCFKGEADGVCHPTKDGPNCPDCVTIWCCGDGVCNGEEDSGSCAIDCGQPSATETNCTDLSDDDGDGLTDCADPDCSGEPVCQSSCLQRKQPCLSNEECCSGKCFRGACK